MTELIVRDRVDGNILTSRERKIFNNLSRVHSPSVSLGDVIQSVMDAITPDTESPVNAVKASVELTLAVQPIAGDTIIIGGKTYTFVAVDTAAKDGDVSVGADLSGAQTALVSAINGEDEINEPNMYVVAGAFALDKSEIVAIMGGLIGNNIQVDSTFTSELNLFSSDTLKNGVNGTPGVLGTMFVDDTYLYIAIKDNDVSDANWRRISLGSVY